MKIDTIINITLKSMNISMNQVLLKKEDTNTNSMIA